MDPSSEKKKKYESGGGSGGSGGGRKDDNVVDADNFEIVSEEIAVLCAIYQDDCKLISKPPEIEMKLRPYLKDGDYEDSEVSAALSVRFLPGYPYKCPELQIAPCRGLSKDDANHLRALLIDQANSDAREGRVMIFNLVEAAKEFLSNIVPQAHLHESTSSETSLAFVRYSLHYDQKGCIGKGGFGRVFRCTHKWDNGDYVIKMVPFKQIDCEKTLREVRALRMSRHPNVVSYYQCWVEDGAPKATSSCSDDSELIDDADSTLFITMEYCPTTLTAKLDGHIDREDVLQFFKQLMDGLAYMHRKGVGHFDIKPDNLFFDESGVLKIGDFGLAALPGEPSRLCDSGGYEWNTTYQAPEVIGRKADFTEKADIYSAGLVLLEMIHSPLATKSERTKLFENARKDVFSSQIDDDIKALVMICLTRDPEVRPSASDIISTHFI